VIRQTARSDGGLAKAAFLRKRNVLVDVALLFAIFGLFFGAVIVAQEWQSPLAPATPIDLDPAKLPLYTLYSLARGVVAYGFSLLFTIAFGKAATASRRAERVLIPILDLLQSIPVLTFMPGLVIGLIGLFPNSNIGFELACVLAIFTGQVWNMAFSFHGSLRAIPEEQIEVARLNGFRPLKKLFALELPSAMNGLVWNSMISMAGGWFFLTVVESFTLDGRTFRLPGLGSYLASAVEARDGSAMAWALFAMIVMIVALDQLVWRPLTVWAERFRHEDAAPGGHARSWLLDFLRGSPFGRWIRARAAASGRKRNDSLTASGRIRPPTVSRRATRARPVIRGVLRGALVLGGVAVLVLCIVGATKIVRLLAPLPASAWGNVATSLLWTALRVIGALLLGAAWAVPVGILIGRSQRASAILLPIIQVVASFPAPMLYPIAVPLLLDAGFGASVVATMMMTLGTQWYVLFNVAAGAAMMPHDLREVTAIFRTPLARRLFLVEFATIFPSLVTGLLAAAGGAWNASIVSEFVRYPGGESRVEGIGTLIFESFEKGDLGTLSAATIGVATALVIVNRFVWRPLQRLATTRFAMNR
jgi:NitT/TauT family transport system permease protein